jgi:hypothetical protein
MERVDSGLRRKMKVNQPKHTGNVVSFQTRSERGRIPADDERRDNIIRILDLSKFEQPRPVVENSASMRANIVAMVLLGLQQKIFVSLSGQTCAQSIRNAFTNQRWPAPTTAASVAASNGDFLRRACV